MPNWNDPTWQANQAARLGQQGAGAVWGPQLLRGLMPTTQPDPRFGGSTPPSDGSTTGRNPILSQLGQTLTGGPSGLAAGIGRYRPPTGMPAQGTFQNSLFNALAGRMQMPVGGLAPQQAAAGAADGRSFGANPGANQMLASALPGFQGNFGGGRFDTYMKGASSGEQETAANLLRALGQPDRITWGMPGAPAAFAPTGAGGAGAPMVSQAPPPDPNDPRLGLLPGGQGPGE